MSTTQKEIVRKTITDAGPKGVLSKVFLTMFIPRYAARVHELNAELRPQGKEITSVPEDGFCRYTLANVGVGAGTETTGRLGENPGASVEPRACVDSGVEPTERETLPPTQLAPPERSVPSMFDCDVSWEDAA